MDEQSDRKHVCNDVSDSAHMADHMLADDPMLGLRQLEKLICEAKEYDSKHRTCAPLNDNKMLNELLDKPIAGDDTLPTAHNAHHVLDDHSDHHDDDDDHNDGDDEHEDDEDVKEDVKAEPNADAEDSKPCKEENNSEVMSEVVSEAVSSSKKRRKKSAKSSQSRKNIKSILNETDLVSETRAARIEEEQRMARQRERSNARLHEIHSQFNGALNSRDSYLHRFSELADEVLVLSSDDEEKISLNSHISCNHFEGKAEIIDLSSGDEDTSAPLLKPQFTSLLNFNHNNYTNLSRTDDDISIIDEPNFNSEDNYEDSNNCGSHTDDSLNTCDSDGRVLVNVAHPPQDPDIFLAPQLSTIVKPHQIGGIRFMYDNVVESMEHFQNSGFGCILSHSMGLGKTLQVIAFIDVFLSHTRAKHVLCIVPINTLQNWISEFNIWLPEEPALDKYFKKEEPNNSMKYRTFKVFDLNDAKSVIARAKEILSWRTKGGVLLIGYEMYRILTSSNKKKSSKEDDIDAEAMANINAALNSALIDPGPDLVVCDEGHRIKNCNAATSLSLKNIKTRRRIVLTGYPLQNNLIEYWCMVDFVRPNYLGLKNEFTNMFERPISNGQCSDSTPQDRKLMRYRAHVLSQLLKGFVQRRSHSVLQRALPVKSEYVILCRMSDIQKKLMLAFLDTAINDANSLGTISGRVSTLLLFAVCCKIWNHPDIIFDIVREGKSADDFDIDYPTKNKKQSIKKKANKCMPSMLEEMRPQPNFEPLNLFDTPLRVKSEHVIDYSWGKDILADYKPGDINNSFKMIVLFEIIEQTICCGDRLLVFSQSLFTLDLIERYLQSRNVPKSSTKWCKNVNYYRLDGSTSTQDREKYINQFNSRKNIYLFLVSTRAGSLGINLVGANRIVIFDASWNPCHDAQAACRIYRYGQTKACYIYRLICDNSLEKKIYDRQVNKQGMANRVVDEQNIESNFTWREIHSLLDDLNDIREPPVQTFSERQLSQFKDDMVRHICVKLKKCITRQPFEHESLLLDRKETKLTNSEKKQAEYLYNIAKKAKEETNGLGSVRSHLNYRAGASHYASNSSFYFQTPPTLPSQITPMPNSLYDLPPFSQPLAPYPPPTHHTQTDFANFESIAESLVRNGNSVKKIVAPQDLKFDISSTSQIVIHKGEEVMIIKTQNGLYLRTKEGNIIAIKGNSIFTKSFTSPQPPFIPLSNDSSFGIIQQNLHCGGTVQCVGTHSRATSTLSHPPELVQLSDDESEDLEHFESSNHFLPQSYTSGPTIASNSTHHSKADVPTPPISPPTSYKTAVSSQSAVDIDIALNSDNDYNKFDAVDMSSLEQSLQQSLEPSLYLNSSGDLFEATFASLSEPIDCKRTLESMSFEPNSSRTALNYSPLTQLPSSTPQPIGSSIPLEASTL